MVHKSKSQLLPYKFQVSPDTDKDGWTSLTTTKIRSATCYLIEMVLGVYVCVTFTYSDEEEGCIVHENK